MLRHAARKPRLHIRVGIARRLASTNGGVVERDIVIVGGGPAGLALASALGEYPTLSYSTFI